MRLPLRVLHVGAEAVPLVKTGGLADVLGALPRAQRALGIDARLLLPGLPAVRAGVAGLRRLAALGRRFGAEAVLEGGGLPDVSGGEPLPVYVVHAPSLYDRAGGPYGDAAGADWPDNLERFGLLGWVAAAMAGPPSRAALAEWQPELVHAHDWHAALACSWLRTAPQPMAASVFTVHNLAYQGLFPASLFHRLHLPPSAWGIDGVEFHGRISFIKAGLVHADSITTVSPRYAQEIRTPAFGCGLDGVLRARDAVLYGLLNGIDDRAWNPADDTHLPARYTADDMAGKAACKAALQAELGLAVRADAPLLAVASRMVHQKGLDLLLDALPGWVQAGGQLAVQGSGDAALESAFRTAAAAWPAQVAVSIGYDEARSHRLMAGADALAVPSRFEPCGLTQMYALRYGTLPVVHAVGGLADTVFDADDQQDAIGASPPESMPTSQLPLLSRLPQQPRPNGFVFRRADPDALAQTLVRLRSAWQDAPRWAALQRNGMAARHSWHDAAGAYTPVYQEALAGRSTA